MHGQHDIKFDILNNYKTHVCTRETRNVHIPVLISKYKNMTCINALAGVQRRENI